MARYYFHIRDSQGVILTDPKGLDFPDSESAREECRIIIESVVSESEERDHLSKDVEFHVVDEHGQTVMVVPFPEVAVSSSSLGPLRTK